MKNIASNSSGVNTLLSELPHNPRLFRLVKEGRVTFTPDDAALVVTECRLPFQRKLDDKQVTVYADMRRRGTWQDASPIAFAAFNGHFFLIDGQHRLHAVIASQRDIEFMVVVHHPENEEELRELFYRFDAVLKRRTAQQILNAVGLAETNGLSRNTARSLYGAVAFIGNGLRSPNVNTDPLISRSVDRRLAACEAWIAPAKAFDRCLKDAEPSLKRPLLNYGTVAVALLTLKHQPEKAINFWAGVARNDGLRRGDPRHTLVSDIKNRQHKGAGIESVQVPALSWNAWFQGRSLKIIKVYEEANVRVLGTPFDGSRRGAA